MNTKRVKTKVYTEHLYCECGGEMTMPTTTIDGLISTWPPRYYHYCDKCDNYKVMDETYPRIVYEEVEVEKDEH